MKETSPTGNITYKTTFALVDGYDIAPDGSLIFYSIKDQAKRNFKTNLTVVESDAIFYGFPLNSEFNGGFDHSINFDLIKRITPLAIVAKAKTTPTKIKMMAPAHLREHAGGGGVLDL